MMFETEIPAPRELTGPAWQYIAAAGGYLGLTLLSIVFVAAGQRDFDHVVWMIMQLIFGIVWLYRYRKFTSKPSETRTLDI